MTGNWTRLWCSQRSACRYDRDRAGRGDAATHALEQTIRSLRGILTTLVCSCRDCAVWSLLCLPRPGYVSPLPGCLALSSWLHGRPTTASFEGSQLGGRQIAATARNQAGRTAVPSTGHTCGFKRGGRSLGVWELPPGAMRFVDPGLGTVLCSLVSPDRGVVPVPPKGFAVAVAVVAGCTDPCSPKRKSHVGNRVGRGRISCIVLGVWGRPDGARDEGEAPFVPPAKAAIT